MNSPVVKRQAVDFQHGFRVLRYINAGTVDQPIDLLTPPSHAVQNDGHAALWKIAAWAFATAGTGQTNLRFYTWPRRKENVIAGETQYSYDEGDYIARIPVKFNGGVIAGKWPIHAPGTLTDTLTGGRWYRMSEQLASPVPFIKNEESLYPDSPSKKVEGATCIQTVTLDVGSGTAWKLGFRGALTSDLATTISSGDLQTALLALSTVGTGNLTVSGSSPNYTVTFTGDLANQELPIMDKDDGDLNSVTVAYSTRGYAGGLNFLWDMVADGHYAIEPEGFTNMTRILIAREPVM